MSHTYGRKEAREAASAMVALMGRRGIRLHQVSPEPIGVLYAPPEPQRPASAPFQAAEIESRELPVRADPLGDEIESRISSLEAPLRSPHSLPLACVPPQIWHTALALAPSLLREWWRGCHVTASLKDRGALWEQLRRSGSSCEGSRLVEVRPALFGGWWATLHGLIKPLMHAAISGKRILSPSIYLWTGRDAVTEPSLPHAPPDTLHSVERRLARRFHVSAPCRVIPPIRCHDCVPSTATCSGNHLIALDCT